MKKLNLNFLSDNKAVPNVTTGMAQNLEAAAEETVEETREELEEILKNPEQKKQKLKLNLETVAVPEVNVDLLKKLK